MIRPIHLLIAIATATALIACGDKPSPPPQTNVSPPVSPPPAASTPAAIPAPPPTATGTNSAETAKDTAATDPKGTMTKEQESKSMPEAGQAGSHSSTALDPKEAPKK